jgi:hypothetical protein
MTGARAIGTQHVAVFCSCRVAPGDEPKTAIRTPFGHFEFRVMTFHQCPSHFALNHSRHRIVFLVTSHRTQVLCCCWNTIVMRRHVELRWHARRDQRALAGMDGAAAPAARSPRSRRNSIDSIRALAGRVGGGGLGGDALHFSHAGSHT